MADELCKDSKAETKYLSLHNTSGWSDLYTSIDDNLIRQIARSPEPPPRPGDVAGVEPIAPPLPRARLSFPRDWLKNDNNRRYKLIIAVLVILLVFAAVIVIVCIVATNRHLSIHDLTKNGHIKGCSASNEYPDFECRYIYEDSSESSAGHEWSTGVKGAAGEWVQVDFHKFHTVTGVQMLQRCVMRQQIAGLRVYFDDDSTQEVNLDCLESDPEGYICANLDWQTLDLQPHRTSYIRFVITSPCDLDTQFTGIREVQIYGY